MKETLYLSKPYISETAERKTRLCANMKIQNKTQTLFFEVEDCWAKYLVTENSDAFILGILEKAMKNNWDIQFEKPMSEELFYGLTTYTIPVYARNIGYFHNISLIGPTTNELVSSEQKAGTGFSAGVDSFYTVLKHLGNTQCPNHNLTHLLLAVNGAAATGISENLDKEWLEASMKKLKPYADALNLELIAVNGNIDLLYKDDRCMGGDLLTTSSFIYALQKLFGIYYWGSAYPAEIFGFSNTDGGICENISVSYVSTSRLRFYHSGSETNRIGKIKYIAEHPLVQKGLTVCGEVDAKNCGCCEKCLRTMAEIYSIGKLDKFKDAFPVETYKTHFAKKLAKELVIDHPPFTTDILAEMKKNGIRVPFSVYPLAFFVYKPFDFLRKHFHDSTKARKIFYKLNLDILLNGRKQSDEERQRKLKGLYK